jgi:DNA-binding XRE family transcriptional regulator
MYAQTGGSRGRGRDHEDKRSAVASKKLRKAGGLHLKALREAASLTQRDLADQVGLRYYTFISQLENGTGRVPPDLYWKFADAFGIDVAEFTKSMLRYYDPFTFKALFGVGPDKELKA